jgi:hypothetical protein
MSLSFAYHTFALCQFYIAKVVLSLPRTSELHLDVRRSFMVILISTVHMGKMHGEIHRTLMCNVPNWFWICMQHVIWAVQWPIVWTLYHFNTPPLPRASTPADTDMDKECEWPFLDNDCVCISSYMIAHTGVLCVCCSLLSVNDSYLPVRRIDGFLGKSCP